ncbi:uncharacterized protein E5676_scaffold255G005900 [Cucumis melo var. makuwa]|uniref:Uncharacterized protein n=1 Tax=Cucumis melo var. makuwa TaxID=1194695 RepID=A0A5D3CM44_CUCMM|nr:uncharacterized protein E5676_scaffold255G005900 [Cucumis melo var. makuwa]
MEGSALRREKERERRRIRDRERRSSMSIEQRERHLARRRRNYQLRRLKYRNVKTTNPSFSGTNSFKAISGTSIAELDLQQNGIMLVGFNHEQESLNPDSITSSSSETLDPRAEILQGRVRLSHIRRLARSIGIHQMFSQVGLESTSNCKSKDSNLEYDLSRPSKSLRHVKRLARMMNSSVKPSANESSQHQTTIAGSAIFSFQT